MAHRFLALALYAALSCTANAAFYLPGVAAREYKNDERVPMYVNKISSTKTQLPYSYYSLPVCAPESPEEGDENLGEILSGDRIEESLYQLYMKRNRFCQILCRKEFSESDSKLVAQRIEEEYTVNWVLDNLPAAVRMYNADNPEDVFYERGFPLGLYESTPEGSQHFLNNHVHFIIKYNVESDFAERGSRIVGFEVMPFSVSHEYEGEFSEQTQLKTCNEARHITISSALPRQSVDGPTEVIFTYDVEWEESDVKWANRWDLYLHQAGDDVVHWFSIINSVMIVLFLSGMIAMIVMRALHRDIAKYEEEETEDAVEESGWKLLHGDVFRPPAGFFGPMFLSVFVGSGIQIIMMTIAVMVFAVLGFLSPANRGGLLSAMLLLFVFMGSFAGYYGARIYKMFEGKAWKRNTLLTALAFPGSIASIAVFTNFFVWGQGSSKAIPFGTLFALLVLWFGVSVPLVFLGSYLGFKKEALKAPVRVNKIPRQIPTQPWYLHPLASILVGGILPFGAVFIELYFIMSSLWQDQVYYLFGFLFLVVAILFITCAEISIVMCYFQLCAEDYNWWWRSFLTSGSSALYLFLYCIAYFVTKLEIVQFVSSLYYFSICAMITIAFFLLTGTIGFLSCLWFTRTIYGAIKVD